MTLQRPSATYSEDVYRFHWEELGVEMVLERFVESKDDIRCELVVQYAHPTRGGKVYSGRLLLIGPNSLRDVVGALKVSDPEFDYWQPLVAQARDLAKERYREGEPPIDLATYESTRTSKYLIRPFVFDGAVSCIYGDGASAKSLMAVLLGAVVASGKEIAGLVSEVKGKVGILDWEDDAETPQERLRGLEQAYGFTIAPGQMLYRRMTSSLIEAARDIRRWVAEEGIRFIIIDSVGMACGGDPNDPSLMIKTLGAARSLGIPTLAVHHIGKDTKDKTKPYGSVYASNEVRMTWFCEKTQGNGPNEIRIALTNQKTNRSAEAEREAFSILFENAGDRIESIRFTPLGSRAAQEISNKSIRYDCIRALRAGALTVEALSEITGHDKAAIRATLNRDKDYFQSLASAPGTSTLWGIATKGVTEESFVSPSVSPRGVTPGESPLGLSHSPATPAIEDGDGVNPW